MKGTFNFVDRMLHHEHCQTMPTTFGRSGIVAGSLVGYHYMSNSKDKENNLVSSFVLCDLVASKF